MFISFVEHMSSSTLLTQNRGFLKTNKNFSSLNLIDYNYLWYALKHLVANDNKIQSYQLL
jgi:hypothetical protein